MPRRALITGISRPGRLLPRRAAARARATRCGGSSARSPNAHYPNLERDPRPGHAAAGRHPRPDDDARRDHDVPAARALQPRRDVVRPRLVEPAGDDRAVHRRRRHLDARGDPHRRPGDPLLPGVVERDLRGDDREPADRGHAAPAAHAVRRRQGLRAPDGRLLPRALRHARLVRDRLQPRVAAAPAGVRDAQGHARGGGDQARPRARGRARRPRRDARLEPRRRRRARRCG